MSDAEWWIVGGVFWAIAFSVLGWGIWDARRRLRRTRRRSS